MEVSINTPALLFPAVTLLMLSYGNRFLSLANLIRNLHNRYHKEIESRPIILKQIKNLKTRLALIQTMQILGVSSFIVSIISMYLIFIGNQKVAHWFFAAGLLLLMFSMAFSIIEIQISTKALGHELSDMEDELGSENVFTQYIKSTFDRTDKD